MQELYIIQVKRKEKWDLYKPCEDKTQAERLCARFNAKTEEIFRVITYIPKEEKKVNYDTT